ncbi:hypothetical protein QFC21_005976 [Naganishia friedmannii]|uniref:Uncharacterized protein n=1 Tax=Naganishia friedmannii TaxID=89922 RepID=A0ACC2V608_9TREE|nr:hypothetical protein QFC21_005976 [Naganishia friedmannii]
MSTINSYPPKTAIELQDMDTQTRLRPKANKSTTGPSIAEPSTLDGSSEIRGKLPKVADEDTETEVDDGFDVISYWAIGASVWFATLALPLLLFPRLLLFLSQTRPAGQSLLAKASHRHDQHYDDLSPLESFLCTQLGLGIVVVMGLCLLAIPSPSTQKDFPALSPYTSLPNATPSTFTESLRLPITLLISTLLALSGFLAYNTPSSAIGSGLTTLLALGNGCMGVWGWWVGAFGVSAGYRSKKTGADKRTSSFPFKNKYAASEQKKEWKKTHRE